MSLSSLTFSLSLSQIQAPIPLQEFFTFTWIFLFFVSRTKTVRNTKKLTGIDTQFFLMSDLLSGFIPVSLKCE